MLESIVNSSIIYYIMGGVTIVGILSKLLVGVTLNKLVKAASIMPKSPHSFMKLVRAKFEHACMVNDHVENVEVFIEKYIHEYQMLGIRLYSWQRLEKMVVTILGTLTIITAGGTYYIYGLGELLLQKTMIGVALIILLLAVYQITDEKFKLQTMKVYMVDYLENVCAQRYARDSANKEKVIIPELEKKVYGRRAVKETTEAYSEAYPEAYTEVYPEEDCGKQLEAQMANIEAKVKKGKLITKSAHSPVPLDEEEEVRPTLTKVEKLMEEEYRPNEAAIREILQEFMA